MKDRFFSILSCLCFLAAGAARAEGSAPSLIKEVYGEAVAIKDPQATAMATARLPLRPTMSLLPTSPLVAAGISTVTGPFASAGIHISTPWMPAIPDLYAATRIECRVWPSSQHGPRQPASIDSCLMMSGAGESRFARWMRLNASGEMNTKFASGEFRAMIDGVRAGTISAGAGVGGRAYRGGGAFTRTPELVSEIRWNPAGGFLAGLLARMTPAAETPQVILSFGGAW